MRTQLLCLAVIGVGAALALSGGPDASAGIEGTLHDFSSTGSGTYTSETEICQPCHTPHNASATVTEAPLWNHQVTATASFTMYDTTTMNADMTGVQPGGVSKLCLSCHDGTVAVDAYGATPGSTYKVNGGVLGGANFGTDLSRHHPIGFTYDDALAGADGGLWTPSNTASGITPAGFIADDMLFSNKVECASCHDVHNDAGNPKLLVIDNANSDLCLTCHDK